MAVDSAYVCLSKGEDDYQYGWTNGSGQVTFAFRAESAGQIGVVVTGRNHARYNGVITVNGTSGAYVSVKGMTVDEDSLGGSLGNGDGVIDAGERVDMWFEVVNSGAGASGDVSLVVRSGDAGVVVVDSLAAVGVVSGGGGTKVALDAVRVEYGSGMADGAVATFVVVVKENGVEAWRDKVKREAHRPVLELVKLRVDDSGTGDGDGVVDAGEVFRLYYGVKNYGTGAGYGLEAELTDVGGGFVFTDSLDTYGELGAVTYGENAGGFGAGGGRTYRRSTCWRSRSRTRLGGRTWTRSSCGLRSRPPACRSIPVSVRIGCR